MEGLRGAILVAIVVATLIPTALAGEGWYGSELPGTPLENFIQDHQDVIEKIRGNLGNSCAYVDYLQADNYNRNHRNYMQRVMTVKMHLESKGANTVERAVGPGAIEDILYNETWPAGEESCEKEMRIEIAVIPNEMAGQEANALKEMGAPQTPCGITPDYTARGNASIYVIHEDEEKICIGALVVASESGVREFRTFLGETKPHADGGGNGEDHGGLQGIPVEDLPKEQYAPILVDCNCPYKFRGETYWPVCSGDMCVVLLPKKDVSSNLCVKEKKIVPCTEGRVEIKDMNYTVITRIEEEVQNVKRVLYLAKGYAPVAIDVEIPKDGNRIPEIFGDYPVINPDPVLRIHLDTYGGNIAVKQIMVERTAKVIENRIHFASCSLFIDDVSIMLDKKGRRAYLGFRVYDGDDPVYINTVHVRIAGKDVTPQFDPTSMAYFAEGSVTKGKQRITITASTEGCKEVSHTEEVYVGESPWKALSLVLALLGVVIVAVVLLRVVMH